MYVWVILATFLAMLASFTLSTRPDIREVTVEPLAEAQIERLVSKHKAGLAYVAAHTPLPDDPTKQVTYVPSKKIDESEIDGYLSLQTNDTSYESWIFCLSKADRTKLYTTSAGCDLEDANRFLVTMGPIPPRWVNLVTGTPNNDYMNALRRVAGTRLGLGYADDSEGMIAHINNKTNSEWIVRNQTNGMVFIPYAITNFARFKTICENEICLIYIAGI